jgi:hypothetical protein
MLISIAKGLIRYFMMAAGLASASGQTSQVTTLNGNWEFAFAAGAPAAERLARFY